MLGVIADYLVGWGSGAFEIRLNPIDVAQVDQRLLAYVRRTQPGRVRAFERELEQDKTTDLRARIVADARRLITFIYETVVLARQRALEEMFRLAEDANGDQQIRDRILRYLELGKVATELEQLVDTEPFSFEAWTDLFIQLDTVDDAREWRGATARFLESSPDHPGLLAGRALAEAAAPGGDLSVFTSNLVTAAESARGRYSASDADVLEFTEWVLEWLHERRPGWSAAGFLVGERILGAGHLDYLEPQERLVIADRRSPAADALAIVSARRIARHRNVLSDLATRTTELMP
jgi:ATP-dependent DNA helicase RecQ